MATLGSTNEEVQAAMNALKNGDSVAPEIEETEATTEESSEVEEPEFSMDADYGEPDSEIDQEASDEETEETEPSEATEEPVQDSETDDSKSEVEDIEYIKADGKKVKIDYTDRERIKKVHQMAAGARKWQSERDVAIKERDDLKAKYEESKAVLDKCDAVIDDDDALFRLITGGRELNDIVEARIAEQGKVSRMSPEELTAYTSKKEYEERMKAFDKREQGIIKREEDAKKDLDTSEKLRQQSMLNSVFNEYRFHGQFGDDKSARDQETKADRMLWNESLKVLNGYEEVTQEIIDSVVKEQAEALRGLINRQADRKAKTTRKQVKTQAKAKAQEQVFDDPKNNKQKQKLQSDIKKGNIKDSLADILGGNMNSFFNN